MCMFHRAPSSKGAWVLDPRGSADIAQSLTRAPQLRSDFAELIRSFAISSASLDVSQRRIN